MSEEVKTEVKKKVSWFSKLAIAVVSAGLGVAATLGIISNETRIDKTINAYVHAAATTAIAGYVDDTVALIQKEITDKEYKEKVDAFVKAVKAKNFSEALKALQDLTSSDAKEKYKDTIEKVKASVEKGQTVAKYLAANNNEELRKLFPEAVADAKKALNIVEEVEKAEEANAKAADAAPAAEATPAAEAATSTEATK